MPRDDFTIKMGVKFEPDENSLKDIEKSFDTFKKMNLFGDDSKQAELKKTFNTFAATKESIKRLSSSLRQYQEAMGLGPRENIFGQTVFNEDAITKQLKTAIKDAVGDYPALKKEFGDVFKTGSMILSDRLKDFLRLHLMNKLENIAKSFLQGIANTFKDAWGELKNIMKSSFMTNSQTRENMFAYGMTAADSYGFTQAKSMLGIDSEEDLWYMNQSQREQFQRVMTKYADKYNELADSGFFDTMLEYQIEMEEFKKDMQLSIVEFIMDNKDTIKEFMTATMQFLKVIMEGVSWLVDNFTDRRTTDEEKAANIDSILNSYTQNNKSMTLNQTNTFNGMSGQYVDSSLNQLTAQTTEALRAFGE